jgi:5-methyltetrahydrofolate--homocysteine methyltransferase
MAERRKGASVMEAVLNDIFTGILEGDNEGVQEKINQALADAIDPEIILNQGMIAAMQEVGRRFEEGVYFIPDMLIAARAMQAGLTLLRPSLILADVKPLGKVVIGTVRGDLHDIGKNLVSMMLEGAGFEVVDLGVDVPTEKFVAATLEHKPDLVGISALLTTTMVNMKATIEALRAANLDGRVKLVVGGAPVTEGFAQKIGADGYASDAGKAVALAKSLILS